MPRITFLASSKPFELPEEIWEYNQRTKFGDEDDFMFFLVQELDDY